MLSSLFEYIDIVRGYKESAVIFLLIAGLTWGCGKLYEVRTGTEGVPWYISAIIFLSLFPVIGFRIWFDQKRQHEEAIQNLKDSRQQEGEFLRQQVADLKAQLNKEDKRQTQREIVTRILKEGQDILPPFNKRERAPDTPYEDWVKKGTEDLHKFVGEDFAVRWGSYEGIPTLYNMDSSIFLRNRKISAEINQRIARLREFLKELGD